MMPEGTVTDGMSVSRFHHGISTPDMNHTGLLTVSANAARGKRQLLPSQWPAMTPWRVVALQRRALSVVASDQGSAVWACGRETGRGRSPTRVCHSGFGEIEKHAGRIRIPIQPIPGPELMAHHSKIESQSILQNAASMSLYQGSTTPHPLTSL